MLKNGSLFLFLIFVSACNSIDQQSALSYVITHEHVMGTAYRITYADSLDRDLQADIENLLSEINQEVSTYIDSSTISRFNQSETGIYLGYVMDPDDPPERNRHFLANFVTAQSVYKTSGGAFDPTVMPLVNYWGFGYAEKKAHTGNDTLVIDSLMGFIGFDRVTLQNDTLRKSDPGVQLDFSAIAKGYAVDAAGRLLEGKGIRHYLVDIGGEIRAKGKNAKGNIWKIGINIPEEAASLTAIQTALPLDNRSVATSGNYRNFYEVDGVKYSHTISPKTGFPERNTLLSASVFAAECMIADAYATAFMVMGVDSAYELANRLPGIEAYFIYSLEAGLMDVKYTDGLENMLTK